MNTKSELDWFAMHTRPVDIGKDFKGLLVSDLHAGAKDNADDFQGNEDIFLRAISEYKHRGFKIIGLGDIVDLWENKSLAEIQKKYSWIPLIFDYRIKGNHDGSLDLPEALLFRCGEKEILCVHGHQGDWFNDDGSAIGRFFIRYIWRNLQRIGFHDPTTATRRNPKKHEAVKKAIHEWAEERKQTIIFGHTHAPESDPPYYFNCGSWVGRGGSGIEIVGDQINLRIFG